MMKKRKSNIIFTLLVVIGLSFISIIWSFSVTIMQSYSYYIEYTISIVSLVIASMGIVLVIAQMKEAKELQEAEFIVKLNQSFVDNEEYARMYVELEKSMQDNKKPKISRVEISNYLTFFETMYILLERKAIKIKTLDDLFEYRFFIAIHNETVQKLKLVNEPYNFRNIYYLEKVWMEYRKNQGLPIYGEENSLYNACKKARKTQTYIEIMGYTEGN